MMTTGLLVLEVNLSFEEEVSLVTMAGKTLGKWGQTLTWGLFIFLFYSLMIAYVSGCGALFSEFFDAPAYVGSLIFCAVTGVLIYKGTQTVDQFNRYLMYGLCASYLLLLFMGASHIEGERLLHVEWKSAFLVVPAMIISFGFHNLVPTLTTYLRHDLGKLKKMIIVGSAMPLGIYLFWQLLILGVVPLSGFAAAVDQGDMATSALSRAVGSGWVATLAEHFAFFALVTSFLSVSLSCLDFLADGLHVKKGPKGRAFLTGLVLVPPFVLALTYPKIFLIALSAAGAFGAVILFGILPALMVWQGRAHEKNWPERVVPGGKALLVIVIFAALLIVGMEGIEEYMKWSS